MKKLLLSLMTILLASCGPGGDSPININNIVEDSCLNINLHHSVASDPVVIQPYKESEIADIDIHGSTRTIATQLEMLSNEDGCVTSLGALEVPKIQWGGEERPIYLNTSFGTKTHFNRDNTRLIVTVPNIVVDPKVYNIFQNTVLEDPLSWFERIGLSKNGIALFYNVNENKQLEFDYYMIIHNNRYSKWKIVEDDEGVEFFVFDYQQTYSCSFSNNYYSQNCNIQSYNSGKNISVREIDGIYIKNYSASRDYYDTGSARWNLTIPIESIRD